MLAAGFVLASSLYAATAYSQAPSPETQVRTGRIQGLVKDSDGEPIKNVSVALACTCLAQEQEMSTNPRGLFIFRELPPGAYTLRVSAAAKVHSRDLALGDGETKTLRLDLRSDDASRMILLDPTITSIRPQPSSKQKDAAPKPRGVPQLYRSLFDDDNEAEVFNRPYFIRRLF